jgi:hypothetical protein
MHAPERQGKEEGSMQDSTTVERDYPADVDLLRSENPHLAEELAGVRSLESVLGWMKRRGLELGSVEIIAQDEFSLDFVVPLPEGPYLLFGIT